MNEPESFLGYNTRLALSLVREGALDLYLKHRPLLVIVFFGANDAALEGSTQHVPLEEYKSNLVELGELLRGSKHGDGGESPSLLYVTPPPLGENQWFAELKRSNNKDSDRLTEVTKEYSLACIEAANRLDVPCVNLHDSITDFESSLSDGLHLSDEGNQIVFRSIKSMLKSKLPRFDADSLSYGWCLISFLIGDSQLMQTDFTYWRDALKKEEIK